MGSGIINPGRRLFHITEHKGGITKVCWLTKKVKSKIIKKHIKTVVKDSGKLPLFEQVIVTDEAGHSREFMIKRNTRGRRPCCGPARHHPKITFCNKEHGIGSVPDKIGNGRNRHEQYLEKAESARLRKQDKHDRLKHHNHYHYAPTDRKSRRPGTKIKQHHEAR